MPNASGDYTEQLLANVKTQGPSDLPALVRE
jgi:hypothetical protein